MIQGAAHTARMEKAADLNRTLISFDLGVGHLLTSLRQREYSTGTR